MAKDDKIGKCPQCGTPVDALMRKGPLTNATRAQLIEAFARAICRGAEANPDDPGLYHMVLNMGKMTPERATEVIIRAAENFPS